MFVVAWRPCRRGIEEVFTRMTTRMRRRRVASSGSGMAETKTKRARREDCAGETDASDAVLYTLPSKRIVHGTLTKRPSSAIKSPYVADALVKTEVGDVPVLAHAPMLDMGGLCVPGAELIMTANDNAATSLDTLIAAARASSAATWRLSTRS